MTLSPGPSPRILVWNAERKSPRGPTGSRIPAFLARYAPDIVLLTEGETGLLPPGGHVITARPLPDAYFRPAERRVLAWSREPWTEVEDYAAFERLRLSLPSAHTDESASGDTDGTATTFGPDDHEDPRAVLAGRMVSGTTTTVLGPVRVHGLCISWHFARVRWSPVRRRPWQDHMAYLDALAPILADSVADASIPTIAGGDFNQTVPRAKGQPLAPTDRLAQVFASPWSIVTAGATATRDDDPARPLIDHLAVSGGLRATSVEGFGNRDADGRRLSDHTGCVVTIARA